ncbi:MAG: alpha/beta hydrolase family esterase [Acidimicrobiia bacterium]
MLPRARRVHVLTAAWMVVASALVAAADPTVGGAAPAGGCSLEPTAGTVARQLGDRTYDLHVPEGLSGPAVPLLLSLHGYGEPVGQHERETGWPAYAADHGFIVAFPDGVERRWDFAAGSPDVAWFRDLVADISARWCVDPRRVYAEGYSNGAMMVERLACDIPDVIAAVAAYGGASPAGFGGACVPSRPVAVGIFHSLLDPISSYPIGVANREEWISRNGCPAPGSSEPGVLLEAIRYAPCLSGVEVVWRVYGFQSHNWPAGPDRIDIADRMWALFERNPRP